MFFFFVFKSLCLKHESLDYYNFGLIREGVTKMIIYIAVGAAHCYNMTILGNVSLKFHQHIRGITTLINDVKKLTYRLTKKYIVGS